MANGTTSTSIATSATCGRSAVSVKDPAIANTAAAPPTSRKARPTARAPGQVEAEVVIAIPATMHATAAVAERTTA